MLQTEIQNIQRASKQYEKIFIYCLHISNKFRKSPISTLALGSILDKASLDPTSFRIYFLDHECERPHTWLGEKVEVLNIEIGQRKLLTRRVSCCSRKHSWSERKFLSDNGSRMCIPRPWNWHSIFPGDLIKIEKHSFKRTQGEIRNSNEYLDENSNPGAISTMLRELY